MKMKMNAPKLVNVSHATTRRTSSSFRVDTLDGVRCVLIRVPPAVLFLTKVLYNPKAFFTHAALLDQGCPHYRDWETLIQQCRVQEDGPMDCKLLLYGKKHSYV